jgi:hypothetical protein
MNEIEDNNQDASEPDPTRHLRGHLHKFDISELSVLAPDYKAAREIFWRCDIIIGVDHSQPVEDKAAFRGGAILEEASKGRAEEWLGIEVAEIHYTKGESPGLGLLYALLQNPKLKPLTQ